MAGGLASGPFVRALLLADCALSVLDADGVHFSRCAPACRPRARLGGARAAWRANV
jgi:hypothetical protein